MNNAIAVPTSGTQMTPWEDPAMLRARMERMVQLMQTVMKKDTHYGQIPGCKQNSLYQPGSQLLSLTFRIGHRPSTVEDLGSSDEIRYRVTDEVFDQATGQVIGYGIGECSSNEEKYAWRRAGTAEEYETASIDRRRIKYGHGEHGTYEIKQVRTNPADVANTVLKMARKRANVNGTIEALAASEIFTQDLEDLPDGMDMGMGDRAPATGNRPTGMAPPTAKAVAADSKEAELNAPDAETRKARKLISEGQEKRLYAICKSAGVDPHDVRGYVRVLRKSAAAQLWDITWAGRPSEYDKICQTIEKQPSFFAKYSQAAQTAAEAPKSSDTGGGTQTTPEPGLAPQPPADAATGPNSTEPEPTIEEQQRIAIEGMLDELGISPAALVREGYLKKLADDLKAQKLPITHQTIIAELSRRLSEKRS
jgi:hypothetical protein